MPARDVEKSQQTWGFPHSNNEVTTMPAKPQSIQAPTLPLSIELPDNLTLIPYAAEDNTINLPDSYLAQVFRRMVREETVRKVFYDGSITNTMDFIKLFRNPDNEFFFVEQAGRETGFFWLNRFRHRSAFINYCFHREFKGQQALAISQACLDFLLSRKDAHGDHCTDVILGLTPASNRLAVIFLQMNGMTIIGRVPRFLYDASKDATVDGIFSYKQRQKAPIVRLSDFFLAAFK